MGLYKIIEITEADNENVALKLENTCTVQVSKNWAVENKATVGRTVWIDESGNVRKAIEVVAAVIRHENRIFATQRGYGEFKDMWEFPGGKMEPGEAPETALVREIREELATDISVGKLIKTVDTDYPNFHITMHVFWSSIVSGELKLLEHEAAKWVEIDQNLPNAVEWLPADMEVVQELLKQH